MTLIKDVWIYHIELMHQTALVWGPDAVHAQLPGHLLIKFDPDLFKYLRMPMRQV